MIQDGEIKKLKRYHREPTSHVWDHFTRDSQGYARCHHCLKLLSAASTTNLSRHLEKKHPLKIKEEDKIPTITPKEQAEIDEKIVQMVLLDINPINIVEKKGFQSLISYIKPGYVIPSRGTLESLLDKHCQENEKKIKILTQTKALYP